MAEDRMPSFAERRAHERYKVARFAWYQTVETDGTPPQSGISYSVDISEGGLGLVVAQPVQKDALLFIKIVFDRQKYHLSAVVRVMHTSPMNDGQQRLGLKFIALPPDARQFLAQNTEWEKDV